MGTMIDIHLHILPGVDDGPETMQETLTLAQTLVREGVREAIATPHYNDEYRQCSVAEVRARVHEVQEMLARANVPLQLFAGHEVLIKPELLQDVQAGRVATLNGSRYLLLELWNNEWIPETERVIFTLRASGITPIIAHPERYRAIQQDVKRLEKLVQQGILAQVTLGSLLGMQGNTARRTAETLLKKGLVHLLASDAHGLQKRPACIKEGMRQAVKLVGAARVQQMTETGPAAIIQNRTYM